MNPQTSRTFKDFKMIISHSQHSNAWQGSHNATWTTSNSQKFKNPSNISWETWLLNPIMKIHLFCGHVDIQKKITFIFSSIFQIKKSSFCQDIININFIYLTRHTKWFLKFNLRYCSQLFSVYKNRLWKTRWLKCVLFYY